MVLIAYRYYSFEAYDFSNVIVGLYSASVFSTQTPFGTMYHVNGACPKSAGIILLHKYHVFSILVAKKKKRQLLIENSKLPYKKIMQRQCLLSVMKLTACSTKETTCTAVLHSIWEDELNLGLKKKPPICTSSSRRKGEWMYLADALSDVKSLRWANCRRLPGVLSGFGAAQRCPPTLQSGPRGNFLILSGNEEVVLYSLREK